MKYKPVIFFHVGLGKTGTTFLQDRFFPKLEGIDYLPRNKYHKAEEYIEKSIQKREEMIDEYKYWLTEPNFHRLRQQRS